MITFGIWGFFLDDCYGSGGYDIDFCVIAFLLIVTLVTLPLDILMLPFEIFIFIFKVILEFILNKLDN